MPQLYFNLLSKHIYLHVTLEQQGLSCTDQLIYWFFPTNHGWKQYFWFVDAEGQLYALFYLILDKGIEPIPMDACK